VGARPPPLPTPVAVSAVPTAETSYMPVLSCPTAWPHCLQEFVAATVNLSLLEREEIFIKAFQQMDKVGGWVPPHLPEVGLSAPPVHLVSHRPLHCQLASSLLPGWPAHAGACKQCRQHCLHCVIVCRRMAAAR
jgi:hypothetical protein